MADAYTEFGFDWGPMSVTRCCELPDHYVLAVKTTAGKEIDVYVSKAGPEDPRVRPARRQGRARVEGPVMTLSNDSRHVCSFSALYWHFGPYGDQGVHIHSCMEDDCHEVMIGAGRRCAGRSDVHARETLTDKTPAIAAECVKRARRRIEDEGGRETPQMAGGQQVGP